MATEEEIQVLTHKEAEIVRQKAALYEKAAQQARKEASTLEKAEKDKKNSIAFF